MIRAVSIGARALLAVALMLGFYSLALAVSAALLGVAFASVRGLSGFVSVKLAIVCGGAAVAIAWSVLPRRDRFEPPGPRLERSRHPKLFKLIDEVAASVRQQVPRDVYLVPDVNAFVASRGGIMGFGSRRVMGLGLPLLQVLTVTELRAVLAHEFGHYHGGDTALGPWVHKTRQAIGRTLDALAESGRRWLAVPFSAYGSLFLHVTHAVSRQQELAADRLAAHVVGPKALGSGLRKLHGAGPAYASFWRNELAPVLGAGYLPPLGQGFASFVAAPDVASALTDIVRTELREGRREALDTHPPLRERLQALRALPVERSAPDAAPAATLLGTTTPDLERALLVAATGRLQVHDLKPATWDEVGALVWKPRWEQMAQSHAPAFKGLSVAEAPQCLSDPKPLAARVAAIAGKEPPGTDAEASALAAWSVGNALAVVLIRNGFVITARPGEAVTATKADVTIEPFTLARELASGARTAADFVAPFAAAGVAALPLAIAPGWTPGEGIPLSRS